MAIRRETWKFAKEPRSMLITKIEAKEACDWLRAAGFPQYVQLFKDGRFPIDTEWAKHDHQFLDKDALNSFCRRLNTLNKCMEMRLEPRRLKHRRDDRDEEDFCAISPSWIYDRRMRRWRRLDSAMDIFHLSDSPTGSQGVSLCDVSDRHDVCSTHSSSSMDSEGHDGYHKNNKEDKILPVATSTAASAATTASTTDDSETSRNSSHCCSANKTPSMDTTFSGPPSPGGGSSITSLEAEGCFSDKPPGKTCTSLLRKMDKLRLRGTTGLLQSGNSGRSRARHVIIGPVLLPEEEGMERLYCQSSPEGGPNSRASSFPSSPHTISSSSSNSHSESSSAVSTPSPVTRVRSNCRRPNSGVGVGGGMTQDNQNHTGSENYKNELNSSSHESLVFQVPHGHKPGTFPTSLAHKHSILNAINWRTGSFHGYRRQNRCPHGTSSLATSNQDTSSSPCCDVADAGPHPLLDHRLSIYDNVPGNQQLSESEGGSDTEPMGDESEVRRLLSNEDVFSALDSVLERISDLQQLVSTWSQHLSEDNCQRGSSSSTSSSSSSSSQDSPVHGSSATSPFSSSPRRLHLEVQHSQETEVEEEDADSCEKAPVKEPNMRSTQNKTSAVRRLLSNEDVFSALDSVLERISDLQQLVSTWSQHLSEDNCQRGSSSSTSSSSSSSSQDSPVHGSSATSPFSSSPRRLHLEVQHSQETEVEEEDADSCEKAPVKEPNMRSTQNKTSRVSRQLRWSSEQSLPSLPTSPRAENQSVSQFLLLQKLSLLKLTALMDKYSPSSKQGWNWTVPKPPRKTKVSEVRGRQVFGVPLLLNVQQTGEPLPPSILRALVYLRTECLDQVGLFRKSGVKSRIQYLRELVESNPDGVSYDGQSAFDIADMVKQYFRDLPEPIFTSKLCESFLHIYQYFPKDQQLVAVQAAILLLPDENREALRTLLFFLRDVVACVDENQMTPTNIAVCLAPSLFHLSTLKKDAGVARSSHRKYSLDRPDQRDLSETLAATQGLASMITEAQKLFQLPEFWLDQCLSAAGPSVDSEEAGGPVSPNQSGGEEEEQREKRNKLQQSTQLLLKEAREKSREWEGHPAPEHVELAFTKMDDGCPLWMWRGSVEVEAPRRSCCTGC
uniref:rho GTPase-activating protein 7 n=1 Tax=Monopterus albus TaxID=43700 RepID=UPI0009B30B07|nr:rho GTPase-activating protein 7-like [Monopterus albus]